MLIFAIIVSIVAGGLIVFIRLFNFKMAEKMGLFQGASINYIAGLLFSIVLALFFERDMVPVFEGIPLWAYLGGLFGVGIIVLSSYLTSRVSSFYLTLLIFLGQLVTGIVIDFAISGVMPFGKILGGILVVIGFGYNLKVDNKKDEKDMMAA